MQQCSLGMLSMIAKAIIRRRCFNSVGFNGNNISFKFHTAQPVFVRGAVGKIHSPGTKSLGGVTGPEDFFGIESDEGVIHVEEETKSFRKKSSDSNAKPSSKKEHVLKTSFGHLRLDSDNQPKTHAQFESNIADSEFSYGSDIEKENLQHLMQRKERHIPVLGKFYMASVNEKVPSDSNQCTMEKVVTGSVDLDIGNDVHEKLDLGFIDSSYFCDLPEEELCVDSNMLESNIQGKEGSAESSQKNCTTGQLKSDGSFIDSIYFEDLYNVSGRSHNHPEAESTPVVSVQNQCDDNDGTFPELKAEKELNFIDSFYFGNVSENICHSNGDLGVCSIRETSAGKEIPADSELEAISKNRRVESSSSIREISYDKYTMADSKFESISKDTSFESSSSREIPDDKDILGDFESKSIGDSTGVASSCLKPNQGIQQHLFSTVGQNHEPKVLEEETSLSQGSLEQKKVLKELQSELIMSKAEQTSANEDEVHTAYKYVLQLRKTEAVSNTQTDGKFDSKGFRILKGQIPDLSQLTRSELVRLLKERVLFSNDDIVILNKPYNLVVHESKTTKLSTLSSVLDDLAYELDTVAENPQLYTVHRLDKETTGCFLLARNEIAAQKLKALFAQRKIEKTYLVVTIRVPDPYEGVIDMPIAEGKVQNKVRMVLQPDLPKELKYKSHVKNGKRAITHYKVTASSENAALLEVWPETGIRHQIRVHLGFGVNCPILGDHKYSHLTKLAPQRLSGDILRRLQIRQSKVRYVPMHIHSRSVMIPEFLEGQRDLFVSAPLPEHFKDTLKSLKFKDL